MNKQEYIAALEKQLLRLPKAERDDILSDYESHFALGEQEGKTEEEVAAALGDPYELAARYLENLPKGAKGAKYENGEGNSYKPASYSSESAPDERSTTGGIVLVVLLSVFVAAPVLGSLIGAWFSLISVVVALFTAFGAFVALAAGLMSTAALAGVGLIFIGIAMLALGALVICGMSAAVKGITWLVKWYVGLCKKFVTEGI